MIRLFDCRNQVTGIMFLPRQGKAVGIARKDTLMTGVPHEFAVIRSPPYKCTDRYDCRMHTVRAEGHVSSATAKTVVLNSSESWPIL